MRRETGFRRKWSGCPAAGSASGPCRWACRSCSGLPPARVGGCAAASTGTSRASRHRLSRGSASCSRPPKASRWACGCSSSQRSTTWSRPTRTRGRASRKWAASTPSSSIRSGCCGSRSRCPSPTRSAGPGRARRARSGSRSREWRFRPDCGGRARVGPALFRDVVPSLPERRPRASQAPRRDLLLGRYERRRLSRPGRGLSTLAGARVSMACLRMSCRPTSCSAPSRSRRAPTSSSFAIGHGGRRRRLAVAARTLRGRRHVAGLKPPPL